jgi:hypothetical protein
MPLPDLDIYLDDVASKTVLDQEITDRTGADTSLQTAITAEATARANADTALQGQISTNATSLSAEVTNRINGDATLQTAITAEATARANADTALQGQISTNATSLSAEVTNRINGDATLQTAITAEATARANADTSLQGQISTNATNLSAEVTNRINSDATLQTNLNNAIAGLLDGVATPGNTLQKLYSLILGSFQEITVTDIAARNAYTAISGMHIFVSDDGDGKWALYKATTAGINATYVKLSDPDLLNAIMSASQIKAAYESNADTNAFTNALKAKLDAISGTNTGNETAISIGALLASVTSKSTPIDVDSISILDSVTGLLQRVTWANAKAVLKTYFDTLYVLVKTSITTLNTGTNTTEYITPDVMEGSKYLTQKGLKITATASGTNTYTATLTPTITTYNGIGVYITFTNANTVTNPTLALNSLTADGFVQADGTAIGVGALKGIVHIKHNGTAWQIIGSAAVQNNGITYPLAYNGTQLAVVNTLRNMYNY